MMLMFAIVGVVTWALAAVFAWALLAAASSRTAAAYTPVQTGSLCGEDAAIRHVAGLPLRRLPDSPRHAVANRSCRGRERGQRPPARRRARQPRPAAHARATEH